MRSPIAAVTDTGPRSRVPAAFSRSRVVVTSYVDVNDGALDDDADVGGVAVIAEDHRRGVGSSEGQLWRGKLREDV